MGWGGMRVRVGESGSEENEPLYVHRQTADALHPLTPSPCSYLVILLRNIVLFDPYLNFILSTVSFPLPALICQCAARAHHSGPAAVNVPIPSS